MAFRDFKFPAVLGTLGLTSADESLYPAVPPCPVRPELAEFIRYGADLAAIVRTEKARSEFAIAPVLVELRRTSPVQFLLFSGVDWTADADLGLNGYCDFLLTHGPSQFILGPPFGAVVEAKNDDVVDGFGQCIAAMVGARLANERAGLPERPVHGVVSNGSVWRFLRLEGTLVRSDVAEYYIDNLPGLMGVLRHIVALGAS